MSCRVTGCTEPRLAPRTLCRGHWRQRRAELLAADPAQRERRRESRRKWRKEHPELVREQRRRYRARHPERLLGNTAAWRARHRERLLAERRAAYAALRAAGVPSTEAARRS